MDAQTARAPSSEPPTDTAPAPLDHFRAGEDDPVRPGVYRVVGRDEESVTLLRVVEDGRRVNSGIVVRVPRADLDALAAADNPDTGLGRLRQAPGTLAERPLYSAMGLLLVGFGLFEIAVAGDDDGLIAVAGGVLASLRARARRALLDGGLILWLLLR